MSEGCGSGPITAFVHRVADDSEMEMRNTTHGGKPVQEVCLRDTEGRYIRLRMSSEDMLRLHLATSISSDMADAASGLTYTLD